MTPRCSFVIPAHNAEPWISKAIYSCRNQTIKTIEIIVVDDGSTDGTGDIADWHSKEDKRVRVFHTENRGRSAARNLGNSKAESGIIMVLDADDLSTRNRAIDTISTFQLKKPDMIYGSFFAMDAMGNPDTKILASAPNIETWKDKKLNFICHSTMAYTKALSEKVQYESGVWSDLGIDDWKFQWQAVKLGFKIRHVKNVLCYYRVLKGGTTQTRDASLVEKEKDKYLATV